MYIRNNAINQRNYQKKELWSLHIQQLKIDYLINKFWFIHSLYTDKYYALEAYILLFKQFVLLYPLKQLQSINPSALRLLGFPLEWYKKSHPPVYPLNSSKIFNVEHSPLKNPHPLPLPHQIESIILSFIEAYQFVSLRRATVNPEKAENIIFYIFCYTCISQYSLSAHNFVLNCSSFPMRSQ